MCSKIYYFGSFWCVFYKCCVDKPDKPFCIDIGNIWLSREFRYDSCWTSLFFFFYFLQGWGTQRAAKWKKCLKRETKEITPICLVPFGPSPHISCSLPFTKIKYVHRRLWYMPQTICNKYLNFMSTKNKITTTDWLHRADYCTFPFDNLTATISLFEASQ